MVWFPFGNVSKIAKKVCFTLKIKILGVFFLKKTDSKIKKLRNFAFLIYPESFNEYGRPEFLEFLRSSGLQGFLILHDKDVKKPHYHVLITAPNPISYSTCLELACKCMCANDHIESVASLKGYARYLCHLDNPDKHRYDTSEVVSFGGAEYEKLIETETDTTNKIADIIKHCKFNEVYSFSELVDYCIEQKREWFKIVCNATYGRVIRDYIKSLYWDRYQRYK